MSAAPAIPSRRAGAPHAPALSSASATWCCSTSSRWSASGGSPPRPPPGPSSITLWVLAALLFFVPQGLAVSDLAARYPEEGGIYAWTKRAFGEGHGFLCGWCYWVNNILYYPNLLMSTAVVGTYVIGRGQTGLADNWAYVLPATLAALWLAVGINIVGVRTGRWLQNLGAIGTYLPGVLLVALGVYAAFTRPAATPLTRAIARAGPRAISRSSTSGPRSPSRSPGSSSAPSWVAR